MPRHVVALAEPERFATAVKEGVFLRLINLFLRQQYKEELIVIPLTYMCLPRKKLLFFLRSIITPFLLKLS